MSDQANQLRQLVLRSNAERSGAARPAPIVVVSGGKGGVGTSTVAVNLAVAMAEQSRVVLADCDPDRPSIRPAGGIEPDRTLADVLAARHTAAESLCAGPGGLRLLCGAWGVATGEAGSAAAQDRLVEQLRALGSVAGAVVVDAGNGSSRLVGRLWHAASTVVLVATGDVAAITGAYAAIKMLAAGDDLVRLRTLVNRAANRREADDVHGRLRRAARRFLGLAVEPAGWLAEDRRIAAAGARGAPLLSHAPRSLPARQTREAAEVLARQLGMRESTQSKPVGQVANLP